MTLSTETYLWWLFNTPAGKASSLRRRIADLDGWIAKEEASGADDGRRIAWCMRKERKRQADQLLALGCRK
jgi:hypothetical protein